MVINKKDRKYQRFSLKNASVGFPGEEKYWGEIVNISRGGFKTLTNFEFEKGEILNALIDLRRVADQALFPNHFEIKIKIIWRYPLTFKDELKNSCGVSFADLDEREEGLLDSLFESLNKSKKASDEGIEKVLEEIDRHLDKFRKPS